jgi:deoxyribodipyrimidine photo-lyase
MLVSFAAYHLWLDWRPVARVLARRFLDFEPGIHLAQCQMQSGVTGINAIRIYDPAKQLRDHDPEGRFVRRWVPELREVPDSWLSRPELMPRSLQERVGCVVGRDYPRPVVEHASAVREARARIGAVRGSARARRLAREVYRRHGSRKQPLGSRARGGAARRRTSGRSPQLDLGI